MARKIRGSTLRAIEELERSKTYKRTVTLAKAGRFLAIVSLFLSFFGLMDLREGDGTVVLWGIVGGIIGIILYLYASEKRKEFEPRKRS